MKVWHFSEMAYHPAWPELRDSYRVVIPNRLFDPKVGADLYHRYLDEWALCDELGINIMTNEHHATATCADSVCTIPMAILARETKKVRLLARAELDAERVDQHQPADPLDRADAHLERDPAAERRPDKHRVVEALLLDHVEVEIGEIVDRAEPIGALRPADPGVAWGKYPPTARQPLQKSAILRKIVAAVQKQQRRAVSGDRDFERNPTDSDALHAAPSDLPARHYRDQVV